MDQCLATLGGSGGGSGSLWVILFITGNNCFVFYQSLDNTGTVGHTIKFCRPRGQIIIR